MDAKNRSITPGERQSFIERFQIPILILGFSALGILILIESWSIFNVQVAWKVVDRSRKYFSVENVENVMIGRDGEPWYIVRKWTGNNNYQLRHVTNGQVNSWDLPYLAYDAVSKSTIIGDDENNKPWIFYGSGLLHWDGNQWKILIMPLDADIESYHACPTVAIMGLQVWGIDSATNGSRIIQLDLDQEPLQAHEIFLPGDLGSNNYHMDCITPVNDGGFYVFLSSDTDIAIYQLQDGEWQRVTTFEKVSASNVYLQGTVVDPSGKIWVLLREWIPGKKVGTYDPQENTWAWLDIEHPGINNREFEYTQMAVDESGRVWLSAEQIKPVRRSIFKLIEGADIDYHFEYSTVGVYDVSQGNKLVEVRHYTTENSSLESSLVSNLLLGPDQRIWTWDDHLVWMDSSTIDLPPPLPGWFATLLTSHDVSFYLTLFYLLLFGLIIVPQLKRKRQSRGSK